MAQCLTPRFIRIDRRKSVGALLACDGKFKRYRDVRPSMMDYCKVPCGKCINCLKNRQNALVSRCLAEGEKKGTFVFVTLTYDNEHLPLAQSLWKVDKENGEYQLVDRGEILCSARSNRLTGLEKHYQLSASGIRKMFLRDAPEKSDKPRYLEFPLSAFSFCDEQYEYRQRITPSVCRKDVRMWIKSCRVLYERAFGSKLDFSYVAVSEYGPNTCRPHYHLAFFGLSASQAHWLCQQWTYGFYKVSFVPRINPDGSDGFACASRYIGKYMTKGKFDCQSVLDGSAEKPRICQSLGIGKNLIDKVRAYTCAFDMYGEYDLNDFFCPSLGRCLTPKEVDSLVAEIPKRLCWQVNENLKLPIPRIFRDKIFYNEKVIQKKRQKFKSDGCGRCVASPILSKEMVRIPTALWALVADSIRTHLSEDDSRQFQRYIAKYSDGEIAAACDDFAYYENANQQIAKQNAEADYIIFLSKSCF